MDHSKHSARRSARARPSSVTNTEYRSRRRRQGAFENLKRRVEDLPDAVLQVLLSGLEQPPTSRPYLLQAQIYGVSARIVDEYSMLLELVAQLQIQKEEVLRQNTQLIEQIRQLTAPHYDYIL